MCVYKSRRKKGILVFVKRDWGQYCYGVGGSKECFRYCVLYVVVCTTWYINPEIVLVSYAYSTTCSPPACDYIHVIQTESTVASRGDTKYIE